ncbi:serine--tRNA ligase [Buchnera aphidicola]|uniref:Serine--tRNA ligase n=1 Tax=Buchnera aphidicola (Cinara cf. splendens/pseudotsugae 3390) TaxID=2518980 RepID=A0A451CXE7_9GAMM|nr:serine--tRNA ligase [Buchnera aphidicola]VFP77783.1 Serine--tRNA ligase [Buchnera aphidicola (Cinara cf. splendens/pseudotsugae 3390)]
MLNFNAIKNNYSFYQDLLKKKNYILDIDRLKNLEKKRKKLQIHSEKKTSEHKRMSQHLMYRKKLFNECDVFKNQIITSRLAIKNLKKKLEKIKKKIYKILIFVPNIPYHDVPIGTGEKNNKKIYSWGKKKKYNFSIIDHIEIGNKLQGFDWKTSSVISGSGYVIMKGPVAHLHRALGQFMLDVHTRIHGYKEVYVPHIVKDSCMFGTGQLPKFKSDLFHAYTLHEDYQKNRYEKLFLIPTSEVPLVNLVQNKIILFKELPLKFVALSSCFRAEKNTYGKNVKGLIRNRQFDKVEIVQIVHPLKSENTLEILTQHAEKILQLLQLPYRKILLCTGELGFSSQKTYDLEVWFPVQKIYREVSSCSMIGDFQARRINARYKDSSNKKNFFLHTLNGSGLAVGRILAAILENFQCSNGKISVPKVLQKPYMNGIKFLM